jgi:hypothetical protein
VAALLVGVLLTPPELHAAQARMVRLGSPHRNRAPPEELRSCIKHIRALGT